MWQRVRWLYLVESGSLVGRDAWRAIHVRCELNEHIGTRPELPMLRDDVFISRLHYPSLAVSISSARSILSLISLCCTACASSSLWLFMLVETISCCSS